MNINPEATETQGNDLFLLVQHWWEDRKEDTRWEWIESGWSSKRNVTVLHKDILNREYHIGKSQSDGNCVLDDWIVCVINFWLTNTSSVKLEWTEQLELASLHSTAVILSLRGGGPEVSEWSNPGECEQFVRHKKRWERCVWKTIECNWSPSSEDQREETRKCSRSVLHVGEEVVVCVFCLRRSIVDELANLSSLSSLVLSIVISNVSIRLKNLNGNQELVDWVGQCECDVSSVKRRHLRKIRLKTRFLGKEKMKCHPKWS